LESLTDKTEFQSTSLTSTYFKGPVALNGVTVTDSSYEYVLLNENESHKNYLKKDTYFGNNTYLEGDSKTITTLGTQGKINFGDNSLVSTNIYSSISQGTITIKTEKLRLKGNVIVDGIYFDCNALFADGSTTSTNKTSSNGGCFQQYSMGFPLL